MRVSGLLVVLVGLSPAALSAQETPSLDGPQHPFQDSLFDRLAGHWTMTGSIGQRSLTYDVHADWVLHHQFLRVDMRDTAQVPVYEAHVYIGRDNTSERYVAHWLDVFGGRWSETLGYGSRAGDSVEFVFEYPDGPFRTRFSLDRQGQWAILMRQKSSGGTWQVFGQWALRRRP